MKKKALSRNGGPPLAVWVSSTANPKDREIFIFFASFPTAAEATHAADRATASFGEARVIRRDAADFRSRDAIPRCEIAKMPDVRVDELSDEERRRLFSCATPSGGMSEAL